MFECFLGGVHSLLCIFSFKHKLGIYTIIDMNFECFCKYLKSFEVRVGKENCYEAELFDLHKKNERNVRRLLRHLVVVLYTA